MICISNANAARLHYAVTYDGLTVYVDGMPALIAAKPYQMVGVAKDCIAGSLIVTIEGDPAQIVDHGWLLRLGANCMETASKHLEAQSK